nr:hypothetical protein [Tanacetum cinerariifolium]
LFRTSFFRAFPPYSPGLDAAAPRPGVGPGGRAAGGPAARLSWPQTVRILADAGHGIWLAGGAVLPEHGPGRRAARPARRRAAPRAGAPPGGHRAVAA